MRLFSQRSFINLLFLIAFAIFIASAFLVFNQMQRTFTTNRMVIHTYKVLNETDRLELSINDFEARINYFIITDNKSLIEKIPDLVESTINSLMYLKTLTKDNVDQQKRINVLEPLVQEKINYMRKILSVYPTDKTLAVQMVKSENRLNIKEQIAKVLDEMNRSELKLLNERNAAFDKDLRINQLMLRIVAGFGSGILLLSFILLNYHLNRRNIAERKQKEIKQELIESNKQLSESEERYLLATEGSNAGLWDWKIDTGEVYLSPYYKKILGYADDELPNTYQSFEGSLYSEDQEKVWNSLKQHLENHVPYDIEYRLSTKSGKHIWVHAVGQALWDKNGKAIRMSGSTVDITSRKIAEKYLNLQYDVTKILIEADDLEQMVQDILKLICESLFWKTGAMWLLDSKNNELNIVGYYQDSSFVDHTFENVTRKTKFFADTSIVKKISETRQPIWISEISRDEAFTRKAEAEKLQLSTAFYFPILTDNELVGIFEFLAKNDEFFDESLLKMITNIESLIEEFIKRKRSEDELKESEYYKTAILESVPDSILTINKQGQILSYNSQSPKMFDYNEEELRSTNVDILIPNLSKQIGLIADKMGTEVIARCKAGKEFPVELNISTMNIENQILYVLNVRDITERKKIDLMKNEFISIVSHELRTPLTSIQGSLDLLADGTAGPLTEDEQELITVAKQNSDRLIRLINDILDIEKIESGKMEFKLKLFEINYIVQEAISANQSYAQKFGVKVIFRDNLPNTMVMVDHDKLLQALANLISNAVKYSPKNEEITVSITEPFPKIVRVGVSDKGAGIAKEFQSRIFQKFAQENSTTTRKSGGTGLGLSITKAIIENLKGTIHFVSNENGGTTFYFDLPIAETNKKDVHSPKHITSTTVLICEDDIKTTQFLKPILDQMKIKTIVCNSIAEAKKNLSQNKIDALILDLVQPDNDGISFIKELRLSSKTHDLPIVVISVSADKDREQLNGSALSILDWLNKPIDENRLQRSIRYLKEQIKRNTVRVLYVEDDSDLANVISKVIEPEAKIVSVKSLHEAHVSLQKQNFDLAIIDLRLSDGSGVELLPELSKKHIPVIVFSAYELPEDYAQYVKSALIKSKTSNKELLEIVKLTLKLKKEFSGSHYA